MPRRPGSLMLGVKTEVDGMSKDEEFEWASRMFKLMAEAAAGEMQPQDLLGKIMPDPDREVSLSELCDPGISEKSRPGPTEQDSFPTGVNWNSRRVYHHEFIPPGYNVAEDLLAQKRILAEIRLQILADAFERSSQARDEEIRREKLKTAATLELGKDGKWYAVEEG
jgi:hypothetical protein